MDVNLDAPAGITCFCVDLSPVLTTHREGRFGGCERFSNLIATTRQRGEQALPRLLQFYSPPLQQAQGAEANYEENKGPVGARRCLTSYERMATD